MGVVEQILDDFKSGRRDVAEFWIPMKDMLVHIRYFAIRDSAGKYRGTLEVTQNIAELQKITGEKRIYDYELVTSHSQSVPPYSVYRGIGGIFMFREKS